jgi:hypothetical protein
MDGGKQVFLMKYTFPEDTNKTIKTIQMKDLRLMESQLYSFAADRYMAACAIVGIETDYLNGIRAINWNNKIPSWLYDDPYLYLAAYYRCCIQNDRQIELPFPGYPTDYETQMEIHWHDWYDGMVKHIILDNEFLKLLIEMAIYHPSERSTNSKNRVMVILSEIYVIKKVKTEYHNPYVITAEQ